MSEDLSKLRDAIDAIDADILQALSRRMQLSDRVIAAKGGIAAFRPGREAQLVRRLVDQSAGLDLSADVILGIWRQIMAASLGRQNGKQTSFVHSAAMPAAVWHMGAMMALQVDDSIASLLAMIAEGRCAYALVPADQSDRELAAGLASTAGVYIISRTPLYPIESILPAYILANYLPDPSGNDISLFLREGNDGKVDLVAVEGYHNPPDASQDGQLVGIIAG